MGTTMARRGGRQSLKLTALADQVAGGEFDLTRGLLLCSGDEGDEITARTRNDDDSSLSILFADRVRSRRDVDLSRLRMTYSPS